MQRALKETLLMLDGFDTTSADPGLDLGRISVRDGPRSDRPELNRLNTSDAIVQPNDGYHAISSLPKATSLGTSE